MTLRTRTLNYGNYGIFLIMGNAYSHVYVRGLGFWDRAFKAGDA